MPLYKEWNVGGSGIAAIWKIEEPESFFSTQAGVESDIKHDKRRIEYLAGRFLLKHLEEEFPVHTIEKDEHDKPRIQNNHFFFSISHSWPYVAVVVDPVNEAGIDIQTWHPNIETIQHKFLTPEEQLMFANDPKLLTVAWCAKEAVYKWNGKRGIDFKAHLPIENFYHKNENSGIVIYFKLSNMPKMIYIESIINTDFACSYVDRTQDWAIY